MVADNSGHGFLGWSLHWLAGISVRVAVRKSVVVLLTPSMTSDF